MNRSNPPPPANPPENGENELESQFILRLPASLPVSCLNTATDTFFHTTIGFFLFLGMCRNIETNFKNRSHEFKGQTQYQNGK